MKSFAEYLEAVDYKDREYGSRWVSQQPKGVKEVLEKVVRRAAPTGTISVFVNKEGFDENDKGKMSTLRIIADGMGYNIGPWKLNRPSGTATAAIALRP